MEFIRKNNIFNSLKIECNRFQMCLKLKKGRWKHNNSERAHAFDLE